MKRNPFLLLLLIALVAVFSGFMPRRASAEVTFSYFYDNLSPYGEWVQVGDDYAWHPTGVPADWRPYTDGYWTYTDAGWTWASYEDFGAITYHYGRWARVEDIGWVWKPDYQWGPAWVSWRRSDNYIGWAPLPFEARFRPGIGISIWADRDYDIGPSAYAFCEFGNFGAPVMRGVLLPPERNVIVINETANITNITFGKTVIFNGGPDYAMVAARSVHPIQTLRLQRVAEVSGRPGMARVVGNQLVVAAPEIVAGKHPLPPPAVARVVAKPTIDRGWAGVTDPAVKEQIKAKYAEETKGIAQNAPAKAVNMKLAKAVLPAKADAHGTPGGMNRPAAAAPATHPQSAEKQAEFHAAPTEHVAPAEHAEPAEHKAPAEHVAPVEHAAHVEHAEPAEHKAPAEHAEPAEHKAPVEHAMQEHSAPSRQPAEHQAERTSERPSFQHQESRPEHSAAPSGKGGQNDDKRKKNPYEQ